MTNNFTSKNQYKYFCEICDFKCIKKGDYNRHLGTAKHKKSANTTNFTSFTSTIPLVENEYNCDCGKKYKHLTSLYNLIEEDPPDYLSRVFTHGGGAPQTGGVMRPGSD